MESRILAICSLVFLFALSNCGQDTEKLLEGEWKAHLLTERLDTLDLPPNNVKLSFFSNHTYYFTGTLRFREAGSFKVKRRIIFLTDTVNNRAERPLHIESLSGDTLILNMMENKIPRRLELHRGEGHMEPVN